MVRRLALSLLLCLCVGCYGDRRHHIKQDVSREKFDHIDRHHSRKPVEVYLKLSDNPQLFVVKKSEGFLFTTARPEHPDRKTCDQCVFRIVCEGPDCAEVCELCGNHASEDANDKLVSVSCSVSREEEKTSTTPKKERTHTTSSSKQEESVTNSNISKTFKDENTSKMTSDESIEPVRKRINGRKEFRRKQLSERNRLRHEARKLKTSRGRTEMEGINTTPTIPKASKHFDKPEERRTTDTDKMTTKSTFSSKSNENSKSFEHFKGKLEESHENEVVFSIPKKKNKKVHVEHEVPASKLKDGVKKSEEELSESTKILKLLEKIIKQKEMENEKNMKDENKDAEHTTHRGRIETTTMQQKLEEMDRNEGKTKKPNDGSHSHGSKLEDHKVKATDEINMDPMVRSNLVQPENEDQSKCWPYVVGKLLQTEIESAHVLIKQKPLKSVLKKLKEHFKPIFVAATRALAKVFGVSDTDDEKIKAKKQKDDELTSSPTTLAPSSTTKITDADMHLSKSTAVKTDTHRRRAFIYSARKRPRHRPRRPPSLRASVQNKLRELESLDKAGSGDAEKSEPTNGCSCNCFASRRIGAAGMRHRTRQRHLDG